MTPIFDFATADVMTPPFARWVLSIGPFDHCVVAGADEGVVLRLGRRNRPDGGRGAETVLPVAEVHLPATLCIGGAPLGRGPGLAGPLGVLLDTLHRAATGERFVIEQAIP